MDLTKKCPHCQTDIPTKATKCPHCQTDLRGFIRKHPIITVLLVFIIVPVLSTSYNLVNETATSLEISPEELAAWKETPSGKLCDKNPSWKKEDCDRLVGRHIWVGMSYDMLVYSMQGEPDSINPSNYGGRTKYQYCWANANPGCFYDDNGDGNIDAYN